MVITDPPFFPWQVLGVVFQEALVRNVYWIAQSDRDLIPSFRGDPGHRSAVDRDLLEGALQQCEISLKLFAFQAAFMELVAHPKGWNISKVGGRGGCGGGAGLLSFLDSHHPHCVGQLAGLAACPSTHCWVLRQLQTLR